MPQTLMNFIPIAAPATRRPCGDAERNFRISMGFLPQWYVQRTGLRFGRQWHEDCEYRYDTLIQMKRYLHSIFPTVPEFMPRINDLGYDPDCATLSGVYGSKAVAMLYGFEAVFPEDDWPRDASNRRMDYETLCHLKPIDLDNNPHMERLEKQMDEMQRVFGRIEGYLNYQGVLNTAQKLRGNEIFMDILEDEEFACDLFAQIAETIGAFAQRVQARQRASGVDIDLLSVSNCVVSMISPDLYGDYILPHDKALSERFSRFGVHTCNWNVTPYLEKLRDIKKMGYLDMSASSDLDLARSLFPDTRLAVFYTPGDIERKPIEEIETDFWRIAQVAHPCDIVFADMTPGTSDEKLNRLLECADRIEEALV